jgi:mRNA interferase MazF
VVTPTAGEVVLVPFPFSDLPQSKVRPAVCLADAGRGDWVLCQITSSPYGDRRRCRWTLRTSHRADCLWPASLGPASYFTAHAGLMVRSVGVLTAPAFARVLSAVVAVLQPPASP